MTIGQRILAARLEAGLSQRQLAGESITRNMLSAIEHDKAKPSLDTLLYLSGMLNRPVGYFLGEDSPALEGYDRMELARSCCDGRRYRQCLDALAGIPEGCALDRERRILKVVATIALARQAMEEGKMPYARRLLEEPVEEGCPYFTPGLERELALLRKAAGLGVRIPSDDGLVLRAEEALGEGRPSDARRYLLAEDDRDDRWHFLMGETLFALGEYAAAAEHYHAAEQSMAGAVRRRLQLCYAALKDFEKAYYYATME